MREKKCVRRGIFQDDQEINQRSRHRGYRRDFTWVCIEIRAEMQKKIRISEEYVVYKSTLHISYKRRAITKAQSGQKLTTTKSPIYLSVQKSHRNISISIWQLCANKDGDKKIRKVSSRRQGNETQRTKKFDDGFKQDLTKMEKWSEQQYSIQLSWSPSAHTPRNIKNLFWKHLALKNIRA